MITHRSSSSVDSHFPRNGPCKQRSTAMATKVLLCGYSLAWSQLPRPCRVPCLTGNYAPLGYCNRGPHNMCLALCVKNYLLMSTDREASATNGPIQWPVSTGSSRLDRSWATSVARQRQTKKILILDEQWNGRTCNSKCVASTHRLCHAITPGIIYHAIPFISPHQMCLHETKIYVCIESKCYYICDELIHLWYIATFKKTHSCTFVNICSTVPVDSVVWDIWTV